MKRVLADTNFYELMLKYLEIDKIRKVKESELIVFYGLDLVRKELRATPKTRVEFVRNELIKLRNVLLSIYDLLVGEHQYKIDLKINQLADDNKTMLSTVSKRAYTSVNGIRRLITPDFIDFEEFKKILRGVNFD